MPNLLPHAILASALIFQTMGQEAMLFDIESTATANTTHCSAILDVSYYVGLSDQELFDLASNSRIGTCSISSGGSATACDLYVKNGSPVSDESGVPLNMDGKGTGCVKAPDIGPTMLDTCFYEGAEYDLTMAWRTAMCTEMGVANAAAQLRYGIINGLCGEMPNTVTTCGYGYDCPDLPMCPKKKKRKICKCCRKICRKYTPNPPKPCLECHKFCKLCEKLCGDEIYE